MLPSQAGPEVLIEALISAGFNGSLGQSPDDAAHGVRCPRVTCSLDIFDRD